MATYSPSDFEKKWQRQWAEQRLYATSNTSSKPKFYALDMFPYPSGSGLHVGHPLGYIASDIVSRYKRLCGYNVLHPMGYDAFGLPAEQYAIQTGQHPAVTTQANITRFREQLDNMGFSYDWDREVRTCDPGYYKWTQWIFSRFFEHWYNKDSNKAEPISQLIELFAQQGNASVNAACGKAPQFSAAEWNAYSAAEQENILNEYRLAFLDETTVNWCEAMGTVLANEEVVNGVSERGGHPVVRKKMQQWSLRITAYADRLLEGLDRIDWSDAVKEIQRNWIGRSEGAEVDFALQGHEGSIRVFTTRPDTIFGATFMVLAPEYEGLENICSAEQKAAVNAYAEQAKNRSEIDRMADTNKTGVFTGTYCINPFTGKPIPVWVSDYVLAGYGTGAIMAVPAHDERDFEFAQAFGLDIVPVVKPAAGELELPLTAAFSAKDGICINSDFLNGLQGKAAIKRAISEVESRNLGNRKINYKLRDAGFSRQRYWGEPFPVVFQDGVPKLVTELPVTLPEVESYKPTGTGESPLAAVSDWVKTPSGRRETNTMPGWAGSSWYFLRYTDPKNESAFASEEALQYWNQVDLYVGGAEHATGHLLYSRFWTKFLFDLGYITWDEPFKKLVNQGMIQGISGITRIQARSQYTGKRDQEGHELENDKYRDEFFIFPDSVLQIPTNDSLPFGQLLDCHIPIKYLEFNGNYYKLNRKKFDELVVKEEMFNDFKWIDKTLEVYQNNGFGFSTNNWVINPDDFKKDHVILEARVEKMSKRWWNVVDPDEVIKQYGADTLRMYEMFLGPLTDHKPWNTNGIEGVYRFLVKFWKLFHNEGGSFELSSDAPTAEELKILHKTIKKVTEDIENLSFNTSVSAFMVCTNELTKLGCSKREILEPLLILLAPFAPHIAEELWNQAGKPGSVHETQWPVYKAELLVESSFSYPVSINGKTRTNIEMALDMEEGAMRETVLADETVQKWLEGKEPKKVIIVRGRIVNVVI